VLLEVGSFIALVVYAGLTYKTWDTTQKQFEATERPWIKIIGVAPQGDNPLMGALSFIKDSGVVRVNFSMSLSFTNVGHSVADVNPSIDFFMPQFSSSGYWDLVSAEERRFCDSPAIKTTQPPKITLFPGDPFEWHGSVSTPVFPQNVNRQPDVSGIVPALIVCVSYTHKGLPNVYQTRAVYELSRVNPVSRSFDIGECTLAPFRGVPWSMCAGGVTASLLKLDRDNNGDDAY
jgi:hypothetical protein